MPIKNSPHKKYPTISIQGKQYVLVKDRILAFNELYQQGSIETQLVSSPDSKLVIVKAMVYPDPQLRARCFTGYSQAMQGDQITALENAETSAVGRALAMMGIGVIETVASADEMFKSGFSTAPIPHEYEKNFTRANLRRAQQVQPPPPEPGEPEPPPPAPIRLQNVELMPEDELRTGVSNNSGKPWYAIQRGRNKIWLTKDQFDFLSDIKQRSA